MDKTVSSDLQYKIDEELFRYEELSKNMDVVEESIRNKLQVLDELLFSYQNALKIILPKIKSWSKERIIKVQAISEKLKQKWGVPDIWLRNDPKLLQETQLFDAIVKARLKRRVSLNKYNLEKERKLKRKIESILL